MQEKHIKKTKLTSGNINYQIVLLNDDDCFTSNKKK